MAICGWAGAAAGAAARGSSGGGPVGPEAVDSDAPIDMAVGSRRAALALRWRDLPPYWPLACGAAAAISSRRARAYTLQP